MTRQATIPSLRAFNRYYTNVLGLLGRRFLQSHFSLTEVRVLYEIAHARVCTAKAIQAEMGIDRGYLSRILDSFLRQELLRRTPDSKDRRYREIRLTRKGKEVFAGLNAAQERSIGMLVAELSLQECEELVRHMTRIRELLGRRKGDGQGSP